MRRFFLPLLALAATLPLTAFALTIAPGTLFTDVRATSREIAGINLLAHEGIVQGYTKDRFGPSRRINRAEFLTIAMRSVGGAAKAVSSDCFPDVQSQWFAPFVCAASAEDIVRGYGDGLFHPERSVTYGEALKMLILLYGYEIHSISATDWAEPYYRAAAARQVDLPRTIQLDLRLTRGLAARLIAAFLAESKGQLMELRMAEAGQYATASSSSSSASSLSSLSSSSSSSSSASSVASSSAAMFTLPPVSHFLIVGRKSDAIASVTVKSVNETARIAAVQVKLTSEVPAINTLELVRADNGAVVAILTRRTTTDTADYKVTYEVQVAPELQAQIAANTDVPLALRAEIRGLDNNGASDQLLEVRTLLVTLRGESSNQTSTAVGIAPFPRHQTAFGRITNVVRTSPGTAQLKSATGVAINILSVSGSVIAGKSLAIEQLSFTLLKTGQFTVGNWRLAQVGGTLSVPCTVSPEGTVITCTGLASVASLPTSSLLLLELRADLALPQGTMNASLQADLSPSGSPSELGSVQWTDQSGHFRWIEGGSPVMRGTKWQ